jgi:predicted CXXCH cytochrome family protein
MHAAGVTCSNCHDPHSLQLRAEGNGVCVQCHKPDAFDTAAHHFHAPGGPGNPPGLGNQCVDCHAPETTYMVVDPRRDHSFRVPRPDLSAALGAPNACTGCHDGKSDQWAADTIAGWRGPDRRLEPHFGEALALGRSGAPGAESHLVKLAGDPGQPAIVRATAIAMLADYLSPESFETVRQGLRDEDAMIRLAALGVLNAVDPRIRVDLAFDLLDDPVRAVRLEAARVLAPVPPETLPPPRRDRLEQALAEFDRSMGAIADRPESLATLANFRRDRGEDAAAEATYRKTIGIHPAFAPAYANLADLYRSRNQDGKAEEVLLQGLKVAPGNGDLHHALGLLRVRQKRYAEAVETLGRAAELNPDNARYGYVHALSLQQTGDAGRALAVLKETHARHPHDRSVLFALATMSRESGDLAAAIGYAKNLTELAPRDPQAQALLKQLEAERR